MPALAIEEPQYERRLGLLGGIVSEDWKVIIGDAGKRAIDFSLGKTVRIILLSVVDVLWV